MTFLNVVLFATAIVQQHGTPYQLNQEVNSLLMQGRNAEAVSTARKAVRAAEDAFGANHPATAMILRNLALAYERTGFYNSAESAAKRSIAILESAFGPNDVSLVPPLNVLTEAYAGEGRYVEARKTASRALTIGPDSAAHYATALHNMGAILESEGRLTEAGEYYRKALDARVAFLPPGHGYTENTRAALERVERTGQIASKKRSPRHDVSILNPTDPPVKTYNR
jgi:tetratricopeptide (TPR) repeat protein